MTAAASRMRATLVAAALLVGCAAPTWAADLTSASYRLRAGHFAAASRSPLLGASHEAGGSLGQGGDVGLAGASGGLDTSAAGFWPIAAGALPSLDLDGDAVPAFLDPDDDNDGLPDVVETNTGVFASPSDTGTNPLLADTDGDGFDDGTEVAAGSDPTDASSSPPPVPGLSPLGLAALSLLLAALGWRRGAGARRLRHWST